MPTHWEPESWSEFCSAYQAGDCRVVLLKRARDWAKQAGWKPRWFRFEDNFVNRLVENEKDFWEAYSANAFSLYRRRARDLQAVLTGG